MTTFSIILTSVLMILLFFAVIAIANHDEIMLTRIAAICMIPLGLVLVAFLILISPIELVLMTIRIHKINKGE